MEHGFRPLKAGKMHPNALKTLPRSASAPQVYVVMLSSHLFMLRVQFCNTALTHRGVLGANPRGISFFLLFLLIEFNLLSLLYYIYLYYIYLIKINI